MNPDPLLNRYFEDLSAAEVLGAEREREAVVELCGLEARVWQELLSFEGARARVLEHLAGSIATLPEDARPPESPLEGLRSISAGADPFAWCEAVSKLAAWLREHDADRAWMRGAVLIATTEFQCEAGRSYGARVRRADAARRRSVDAFLTANLRLVVSVAKRYSRGTMSMLDLIQEGNIGLMKAVERFDHSRGYRFSTYATWWIRHAVTRSMVDRGRTVRLPGQLVSAGITVAKVDRETRLREGRDATVEEIVSQTGLSEDRVVRAREVTLEDAWSLNAPAGADAQGASLLDRLSDADALAQDDALDLRDAAHRVRSLFDRLTPQERSILRWRFGIDGEDELTLAQIGEKFLLTRERIRQLQERAIGKMRKHMRREVQ